MHRELSAAAFGEAFGLQKGVVLDDWIIQKLHIKHVPVRQNEYHFPISFVLGD